MQKRGKAMFLKIIYLDGSTENIPCEKITHFSFVDYDFQANEKVQELSTLVHRLTMENAELLRRLKRA